MSGWCVCVYECVVCVYECVVCVYECVVCVSVHAAGAWGMGGVMVGRGQVEGCFGEGE